jgi:hypothetical protein
LGLTAIGELLARLAAEALQRAYQRDPEAIERWRRLSYPAIARQARTEGGEVFFWDESGFRADAVHRRTWSVKGQTPVVARRGNGNRSVRHRRSTPGAGSGLAPMRVG